MPAIDKVENRARFTVHLHWANVVLDSLNIKILIFVNAIQDVINVNRETSCKIFRPRYLKHCYQSLFSTLSMVPVEIVKNRIIGLLLLFLLTLLICIHFYERLGLGALILTLCPIFSWCPKLVHTIL